MKIFIILISLCLPVLAANPRVAGGLSVVLETNGTHYVTSTGTSINRSSQDRFKELGNIADDTSVDGSTDNTSAINTKISNATAGDTIWFPRGTTRITGSINVTKSLKLRGEAGSVIQQVTANTAGINVTASDVLIEGLDIRGSQFSANSGSEHAIILNGTSAASPIQRIKVIGCTLTNWGQNGIYAKWANDLTLENNRMFNIYYAGIHLESCLRGVIGGNIVSNIVGTPNAYGIALTRAETSSLSTDPRTSDFTIVGNVIRDVTNWEGIDAHAGQRITILANAIYGCYHGIVVTRSNNGSAVETYASFDVTVTGNTINSGVTDGSKGVGIIFVGATGGEKSTGVINGNFIKGHGEKALDTGTGGIFTRDTMGLVISGNTVIEGSRSGINPQQNNTHVTITGNTIIDPWTDTGIAVGIRFREDNNSGFVSGNRFGKDAKSATSVLTHGIYMAANNTGVVIGQNSSLGQATSVLYDTDINEHFDGSLRLTSYIEAPEEALPSAPVTNRVRVAVRDSGGNTEIGALFSSGSFIPFATQGQTAWQTQINALVSDTVFGASWNGVTTIAPSKNAVYDEMINRQPLDADLTTIANNNPGNSYYYGTDSGGTKGFYTFPGAATHTNTVTIACSDMTTALTAGTTKAYWRAPFNCTVVDVRASVITASSSGVVTADINDGGTTILSTKLTIDASEKTSTTAATPYVLSDTALSSDAEVTIDIDAEGTNAAGLLVTIYYVRVS